MEVWNNPELFCFVFANVISFDNYIIMSSNFTLRCTSVMYIHKYSSSVLVIVKDI